MRDAWPLLAMGLGYWLLQVLSVMLAAGRPPYPIWLADGFALGVWFVTAAHVRPALLVVVLLANMLAGKPTVEFTLNGFAGSLVNTFQLGAAAWLLALWRGSLGERWSRPMRLAAFLFGAAGIVNAIAALGSAWVFHFRNGVAVQDAYLTLFISDGLGIILITPLLVAWADGTPLGRQQRVNATCPEAFIIYALVATAAGLIFSLRPDTFGLVPPIFYLAVPFILWAAVRFELAGATLALTIYSLIAIYFTMRDAGPFVAGFVPPATAVLQLQGFLAVLIVCTLFASTLMRERRLAGLEIRSWQHRYNAALRSSGNAVFEIEPRIGTIHWAGDTSSAFGVAESSINTTHGWTARIHPDDRALVTGLRGRLTGGDLASIDLEYRVRGDDGAYRLLGVSAYGVVQTSMIEDHGGDGTRRIVGFVKDITEKSRLAAERQHLEAELRQAQKMDAIGRLAGGIAHDFNNILAAILGYSELARDKSEPGGPLQRYLDTVIKAGERGKLLVSQILTFGRKATDVQEDVDLLEIVNEVSALVRGSHPHQVEVRQYCSHKAATVRGNPVELHQMVMNLATNALQAMPNAGRMTISIHEREIDSPVTLLQGVLTPGRHVVIEVSDEGSGIDTATRERMFEPFFTTKPVGKGTGLGLSMAMTIAKSHGGGIDLDSQPGHGSTFTVYLPASLPTPAAVPAVEAQTRLGDNQRILIADDDPALRELATQIFSELGYQSESYADGAAAWEAFHAHPERYDALLTDEVMPNLTGSDLAARISALKPGLPIFLVTAYCSPGLELRAHQAGVLRVLSKPYRRADLAEAFGKALGAGRKPA